MRSAATQRILDVLTAAALLSLTSLCIILIVAVHELRPSAESTLRDAHVTVLEAGLTLKNVREASEEWKKASAAQAKQSTEVLADTRKTLERLRLFADHTDLGTQALLATARDAISNQNGELGYTQAQFRANLVEMQKATVALTLAIKDVDGTIADPKIKETIAHLDDSSAELSRSMVELTKLLNDSSATAADVRRVADKVADEYTKTRNLAYALFKELLGLGSQAVQFAK